MLKADYIPVRRILAADGVENSELLPGNRRIHVAWDDAPVVALRPGAVLLLDFGRELAGGAAMLSGLKAGRVRITFGESVAEACGVPDQTHAIHRTELDLPRLGMHEFGTTGFRFLRLEALTEFGLLNVMARSVECPVDTPGRFECDDERVNRVWRVARRTVHLCMGDLIYDGAKRDRLVWMGDLYPEIRSILVAFGPHPLIAQSLDFLRDHTPTPSFMNNISTYSLWWVVCQYEYFRWAGDMEYLRRQHGYLRDLLRQFSEYLDENGTERVPGRRFTDRPSAEDPAALHAGIQGLYLWGFRCGLALAEHLGDSALANLCRNVVESARRIVPEPGRNKTAAALQTLGGLKDQPGLLTERPTENLSTFGGGFVLNALARCGYHSVALGLLREYWGAMLDRGATTFWEDFDPGWLADSGRIDEVTPPGVKDLHADFGNHCYRGLRHSLCHGWASMPCSWLVEHLAGVDPGPPESRSPGFTPRLCDLAFVRGSVSVRGRVYGFEAVRGKEPVIVPGALAGGDRS